MTRVIIDAMQQHILERHLAASLLEKILRSREDFKKLLADLEATSPPKRELAPPPRPAQ